MNKSNLPYFKSKIKETHDQKKKGISRKKNKKETETGQNINNNNLLLNNTNFEYEQKLILEQLNKLTSLINRIDKRIIKIENRIINKKKINQLI